MKYISTKFVFLDRFFPAYFVAIHNKHYKNLCALCVLCGDYFNDINTF